MTPNSARRGPATRRDLATRLSRVESRNVTFLGRNSPFWAEASGVRVRDTEGKTYLDFTGAFGVAFAGHRHPLIMERIAEQSGRLVHGMGDLHPSVVKVEFLEALAALMPWPETRTVLGLSGSDAVEAALKTAQLATGRTGIVAFQGGYHGLTLGALSVTHREHFRRPFTDRLADHVRFLPFPTSAREAERSVAALSEIMAKPDPPAAVIVEPIQGRAGVRVPPAGFLKALGIRTRRGGALLIVDEVFTGMGRTGGVLACTDEVVPDLVCLGKALGGGMPLSACCGPAEVMDAWPLSAGEAIHTSTFLGHPLGCAAGLGFLAALAAEDLIRRARRLGERSLRYLETELEGCDLVRGVRGRGLMLGIELRMGLAPVVAAEALERGLIVLPAGETGQVVEVTPPATVTTEELENGLEILVTGIREASRLATTGEGSHSPVHRSRRWASAHRGG